MRQPSKTDRLIQIALALALVAPLLYAFAGQGGFEDAYGAYQSSDPAFSTVRRTALAAATARSIFVGVLSTALALMIGIPAGWALSHSAGGWSNRGSLVLLMLAALPLALPASVTVSGWVGWVAPAGAASRFNVPIPGFAAESRGWLFSEVGVALVLASNLWPLVALEAWPAFRRARNEAYESALLYGSRSRAFFKIVIPQARGEIAAGALLVFLLSSTDFSVCSLLLVRTLPIEIHDALMVGRTASAAWAALPLLSLIAAIALFSSRLNRAGMAHETRRIRSSEMPRGRFALSCLAAGVMVGFWLPMSVCFIQAQNTAKPLSHVFGAGKDALGASLRMAAAAAVLSVIVAIGRLVLWPETRTRALNLAGLFLLAIPGSFLAAALLTIQMALTDGMTSASGEVSTFAAALPAATLAFAFVIRFLYVPLRLVEEGLAALDPDLLDAAALSGHGRIARAVTIALPLILPHIAAATALVFVFSLGEVPMTSRLAPPGLIPATVWLFQQQHLGYDEAVFALSLLLGGVVAGALFLGATAMGFLAKWSDRRGVSPVEL